MANSVLNWVWEHSRSRHAARLVLLSLADSTQRPGGWTWPSVPELMARTGLGARAVQAAIIELAGMGELTVEYNAGPKGCNRYQVSMATPAESAPPQTLRPPAESAPPPQSLRGSESPQVNDQDPAESAGGAESAPPQTLRGPPANFAGGTLKKPKERTPTEFARPDSAQVLVGEWLDHCRKRPPDRVIGQIAKELRALLAEGQDPGDVRRGLAQWHKAAKHPSTLASFVNEVMNGSSAAPGRRVATTDQRVADAQALKARMAARTGGTP